MALGMAFGADAERGAVLAGLASCEACHTGDGAPYGGGHRIETPFGEFFGSNLTPDPEHGLGRWSYDDFVMAMRRGRSPSGHGYWPAFPYTSFTGLVDQDLADLWTFLQTVPAVDAPNSPHESPPKWQRGLWRLVNFKARAFRPAGPDPVATRGQYLVEVVGHCGECHSPRGAFGKVKRGRALQGGKEPFAKAPPIDAKALESWSEQDLETFFTLGMDPDGDFAGGGMGDIVSKGTSRLSAADRAAMIAWLKGED